MSRRGQKMLHERRVQAGLEAPTELDRANAHRKEQWMEPSPAAQRDKEIDRIIREFREAVPGGGVMGPLEAPWWKRNWDEMHNACEVLVEALESSEAQPTPPSPPPRGERSLEQATRQLVAALSGAHHAELDRDCPVCTALVAVAAALAQPPAPTRKQGNGAASATGSDPSARSPVHQQPGEAADTTPPDSSSKPPAPPSVSAGRGEGERAALEHNVRESVNRWYTANYPAIHLTIDQRVALAMYVVQRLPFAPAPLSRAPEGTAPEGENALTLAGELAGKIGECIALKAVADTLEEELAEARAERDKLQQLINEKLPLYVEQIAQARAAIREAADRGRHLDPYIEWFDVWLAQPAVQAATTEGEG